MVSLKKQFINKYNNFWISADIISKKDTIKLTAYKVN